MTDDTQDDTARIDEIFVGLSARAANAERDQFSGVTAWDISAYFTDPDAVLTETQMREINKNPRLRANFDAMASEFALFAMPLSAAAATDEDDFEREFEGCRISILASPIENLFDVIFAFNTDRASRVFELVGTDGMRLKLGLPETDELGRAMVIFDTRIARDETILSLLRDPYAQGTFY